MHLVTDEDVDMDEEDAAAQIRLGRLGDWAAVGWMAAKHSRRVYGVEFMCVHVRKGHSRMGTARGADATVDTPGTARWRSSTRSAWSSEGTGQGTLRADPQSSRRPWRKRISSRTRTRPSRMSGR